MDQAILRSSAAALVLLLLAGPTQPRPSRSERVDSVEEILRLCETGSSSREVSRRLVAMGEARMPELLGALGGRLVDRARPSVSDSEGPDCRVDALVGALGAHGLGVLRSAVGEILSRSASPASEVRLAMLHALGAYGTGYDVNLLAEVGTPSGDDLEPRVFDELVAAVHAILLRDFTGFRYASSQILSAHEETARGLLDAVCRTRSTAALRTLVEILGFQRGARDALVLVGVGRLASALPKPFDAETIDPVSRCLESADKPARREAVLALGRLEAFSRAWRLVELLDDEDESIRECSRWALSEMTGLRFGDAPHRWRIWLERQTRWYEEDAPRLLEDLRSEDMRLIVRSLNELSQSRYRIHEFRIEVESLLEDRRVELRRHASLALGAMGRRESVPELVPLLDDPAESVRTAAWTALRNITRSPLQLDGEAWAEALESGDL